MSQKIFSAISQKNVDLLGEILKDGCDDIDEQNEWGFTPLISAARNGVNEAVQLLITHGANINIVNNYGFNALGSSAYAGHANIVETLLNCKDVVFINQDNKYGHTPLISASKSGHVDVVDLLLKYMKDNSMSREVLNTTNFAGNTALHEAALEGHSNIVKLLLKYGSDTTLKNESGQTPRLIAKINGYTEIAELLEIVEENALNSTA